MGEQRGRGGKPKKARLAVSCCLQSSQESTQKIVTVSFRNCALSGKNTLALFFSQVEMSYEKSQKVWGQMEASPLHIGTHGYGLRAHNAQARETGASGSGVEDFVALLLTALPSKDAAH